MSDNTKGVDAAPTVPVNGVPGAKEASGAATIPAHSPGPWTLKGEGYGIPFKLKPGKLPPGLYHPLDTPPIGPDNDDFQGGVGMIQIVRYSDSPVGPYDELLIIPGRYFVPGGKYKGKTQLRATRFYVSQRETTYNGRKNWNIPKQLARFEFSHPPATPTGKIPKQLKVRVYPWDSGPDATPFFSCTLSPSRLLPGVPTNSKWLPFTLYLVQPPVGHGEGKGEDLLLYESDRWCGIPLATTGRRTRYMSAKVDPAPEEEKRNGTHWPAIDTWGFGLWLEGATLLFPVAEEFNV